MKIALPTSHPPTSYYVATLTCLHSGTNYSFQIEADAARAEGTIVYAVGVGAFVPEATLLGIGGDPANVFDASDFNELEGGCFRPPLEPNNAFRLLPHSQTPFRFGSVIGLRRHSGLG